MRCKRRRRRRWLVLLCVLFVVERERVGREYCVFVSRAPPVSDEPHVPSRLKVRVRVHLGRIML